MEDERSLRWRGQLQSQSGVVSREQARAAGFTEKAIAWRLRSGTWQRIHRGAYATFTGDPSREGKLWAAVLCVGPGAVLSHETAAEVHGLTDKPSTRIHISVPAGQNPSRRSEDPGRGYPQVSVPGAGVAAALAAAADHGGGHGPRPDRRGAVLRRRLRLDLGRRRPPPHHPRTARQSARRALADALAHAGSPAPYRTQPTASTPRWNATTSTVSSAPTACPRRGARPGAGTAAGTATWTTCTRSMGYASNWTESRPTRRKAAGATPAATTPTCCRERTR